MVYHFPSPWRAVGVFCFLALCFISIGFASCSPSESQSDGTSVSDASGGNDKAAEVTTESIAETKPEISVEQVSETTPEAVSEPVVEKGAVKDESSTARRPNILLIIADDFGVDSSLEYHDDDGDGKADDNRAYATTPNIRMICRTGVRFRNAWTTPLCSSTRASMLTGRYGFRTGIGEAIPRKEGIGSKEPSIPKILDANATLGYVHANVGKWHLGTSTDLKGDDAPNTMGWSHYIGSLSGELPDFARWTKITNGKSANVTNYATTENVKDAQDWLGKQDKTKPWFLWLAFNAPHNPIHAPPGNLHNVPGLTGDAQHLRQNAPLYYRAMVEAMDTEIGNLIKYLKANNMYDNTLIVFLGDNGTQNRAVSSPYDRTRSKGTVYQNGIHVPFCATGSGVQQGGRTSDALVHSVDLFATLLEAAGVDLKNGLTSGYKYDSVSFLSLLKDPNATFSRTWNYSERFAWGQGGLGTQTIRNDTYKIIRVHNNGSVADELYNLKTDALEKNNILEKGQAGASEEEKKNYNDLVSQLETLLKTK